MTQISANISPETRDRLERYVRARGLKKGFVIEQALLHHLQVVSEFPDEALIPPRFVLTAESGADVLERLTSHEPPNPAMQALFSDSTDTPREDA
jgi:hypothetical protein